MKNQSIALDLKVARRKAGLLQSDLAHLLGIDRRRVRRLEQGEQLPTVCEVLALSFVYGKPIEALTAGLIDELIGQLVARLRTLPEAAATAEDEDDEPGFNRAHTLAELARRLEVVSVASV